MTDKIKKNTSPMGIIYDTETLFRFKNKKYIVLAELCNLDIPFKNRVKILDVLYPDECHEQHCEEMEMSESNYRFIQSL